MTNLLGGLVTLTDVRDYRPVHLAHHRHLGTESDTERTYMCRLDAVFVTRAITGVHVLSVMKARRESVEPGHDHRSVVLGGATFHVGVIGALILAGKYPAAFAWALGVGSIYPLVQSLRQLLEHRQDDAVGDLSRVSSDLRPFTRMFSMDRLGPLFSGVGFNRHLLHHWDPGVSYTRLRAVERWLRDTEAECLLAARRYTYRGALRRLWGR
jgi:fatty acid desaturase